MTLAMRLLAMMAALVLLPALAIAAAEPANVVEARKSIEKGDLFFKTGKLEEALAAFTKARAQAATLVEAHQRYQDAMTALGRWQAARDEYEQMVAKGPLAGTAMASYLLGRIERNLDAKAAAFRAALKKDPDSFWALHGLGYLEERYSRYDESEKLFRRLIALRPESPVGYNALGFCFMQQGRDADAEKQFNEALKRAPQDTEALLNIGYLALREHKFDLAVERTRKVLAVDKDNPWALNNLGKAYYYLGHNAEAERAYKAALSQPRYDTPEIAYLNLSFVYHRRHNFPLAAAALHKAIEIDPKFAYAYNCLAQALFHQNKYLEAWNNVHKAQALGYEVRPEFLAALAEKVPDPKKGDK